MSKELLEFLIRLEDAVLGHVLDRLDRPHALPLEQARRLTPNRPQEAETLTTLGISKQTRGSAAAR
jgi:hypothetical protein